VLSTTDTLLVGVLGVVVGAVASGVVQTMTAASERRRQARVAARLLLLTFSDVLREMRVLGSITDVAKVESVDWTGLFERWATVRESIALYMGTYWFIRLDGTIDGIRDYAEVWNSFAEIALTRPDAAAPLLASHAASVRSFVQSDVEKALGRLQSAAVTRPERAFELLVTPWLFLSSKRRRA
jgi:hypothetical protein